jgi:alpha-D-ribose 1-methylphosphonate 5-triphosphate diphosphatase PhnM
MSELSVEQRLADLEERYSNLKNDVLFNDQNITTELAKRIDRVHEEVITALMGFKSECRAADGKIASAVDAAIKTLEEARDRVHGEVLNNVAEEVLATLSSGSHGMVRVAGQPHPVLTRIK